jgi:hypothetical protein
MLDIFKPVIFRVQSNSHMWDLTLHWSWLYQLFLRYVFAGGNIAAISWVFKDRASPGLNWRQNWVLSVIFFINSALRKREEFLFCEKILGQIFFTSNTVIVFILRAELKILLVFLTGRLYQRELVREAVSTHKFTLYRGWFSVHKL